MQIVRSQSLLAGCLAKTLILGFIVSWSASAIAEGTVWERLINPSLIRILFDKCENISIASGRQKDKDRCMAMLKTSMTSLDAMDQAGVANEWQWSLCASYVQLDELYAYPVYNQCMKSIVHVCSSRAGKDWDETKKCSRAMNTMAWMNRRN